MPVPVPGRRSAATVRVALPGRLGVVGDLALAEHQQRQPRRPPQIGASRQQLPFPGQERAVQRDMRQDTAIGPARALGRVERVDRGLVQDETRGPDLEFLHGAGQLAIAITVDRLAVLGQSVVGTDGVDGGGRLGLDAVQERDVQVGLGRRHRVTSLRWSWADG